MSVGFFQDLVTGFVSLVYPPHCLACRRPLPSNCSEWFCACCWMNLPENRSFPQEISPLSYALAACAYEGLAKRCVLLLKYDSRQGLAGPMGRRMVQTLQALPDLNPDFLVPVPLFAARLRQRQFNQAELLARAVGQQAGIPLLDDSLVRHRPSRLQSELSAAQRRSNVQNLFSVVDPRKISGRNILLIDDVWTTGATGKACAQTLLQAGAKRVGLLAFAHG